jgi:hypothetical protein
LRISQQRLLATSAHDTSEITPDISRTTETQNEKLETNTAKMKLKTETQACKHGTGIPDIP